MKIESAFAILMTMSTFSSLSWADIGVRDPQTSEVEFQAEALAHGHIPIANWLAGDEHRLVPASLKEVFQARLIDAQSAWIRRTPGEIDMAAIDRFLDLETEADWASTEREAFIVFANRKSEARPTFRSSLPSGPALRPDFPEDVSIVLLNGREIQKSEIGSVDFRQRASRVTLLSNAYAPFTMKLSGFETVWPQIVRRSWVTENCAQISAPSIGSEMAISILASERCRDSLKIAPATQGDRELIEKFGLDRLKSDPVREPAKPKSWAERPWVWAAVGVLAVGAVIAIERNQNQTSLQPVSRQGW